ncbi:hypothetical protein [Shewanella sp. 6_MG-2023]|uniref:hypothetical protein n=1 Tax=Shewanella sp. 6_MG-2023 TaxID=3062660 RepID=UPI0026E314C2|nr:hypothetical protein [Shewanella sp. 6_MG-2023]MDO6617651.1 hypothetical protein [Shewanella sp. 6_MG-2023]
MSSDFNTHTMQLNKMNKRIVIHAGPGKTGTSAIQHWLNSNCEALSSAGIYYPEHEIDTNNVSSGNLYSIYDRLSSGMLVLNTEKVASLKRDFINKSENILLLSSEFFFLRVVELHKVFPEAEFVFYLRNPLELIESNYNQSVKRQQNIEPFRLPETVNFKVFSVLTSLFEHEKKINITIQPYSNSQFFKGNIIQDLLKVVGVETLQVESTQVNSSYSLEALEFKRNANFFLDKNNSIELDLALQAYQLGEFNYSLMSPVTFSKHKLVLLEQMDVFIGKYNLSHLSNFRDELASLNQRVFKKQATSLKQLELVLLHIKQNHPLLFNILKQQVSGNKNYILPCADFYSLFNVETNGRSFDEKYKDHKQLTNTLLSPKVKNRVDVCREVGLFLEQRGHGSLANEFFETAYHIDPKRPLIIRKINAYYQAMSRKKDLVATPKSSIKQRISSAKKRFFNSKSSKT